MLDQFFEEEEARTETPDSIAVGIDLGTTNTVVAYSDAEGLRVLPDENNQSLLPSVVAYPPGGGLEVGYPARSRRLIDPTNTVASVKRIIGQPYSSPRLQQAIERLPYRVVEGENLEPVVRTRAGDLTVPQVSCRVVERARQIARIVTGQKVSHCVITVPANFNDAQRHATRQAARLAKLDVLRILNEPTAAALAYGLGRSLNERIAVFDLGGGTFDLSVLAVRRGLYEVLATGGDPFLGGDDMDYVLADELARRFLVEHNRDPRTNSESQAKILAAAEEIKAYLSSHDEAVANIAEVDLGLNGMPLDLKTTITLTEFESMIEPIVSRAIACAESVLAEAKIKPEQIDQVLLVGGSTLVPLVRERVETLFGKPAMTGINPMEVVALGAAAHAQALFAPGMLVGPLSTPTSDKDGSPATGEGLAEPEGPQTALLLDVTSHSVGLATTGGFAEVLLPKNTQIPAEVVRFFSTAHDDQDSVVLKVCQGANPRFEENEALGELTLEGLRPGPRGQVRIEVGFLVDADGLLQVSAKDQDTGANTSAVLSLFGFSSAELSVVED